MIFGIMVVPQVYQFWTTCWEEYFYKKLYISGIRAMKLRLSKLSKSNLKAGELMWGQKRYGGCTLLSMPSINS